MNKITWLALAASLLFAVPAHADGPMPGGSKLIFSTGGEQGTYFAVGGVIAGSVGEKTSTSVVAISSGGSKANIEAIEAGDAQLGFSQTDVADYAFNGKRLFEKTGKITVKKGLKKGVYKVKVKVTIKGTGAYKSKSKTVTVKIKVK